MQTFREIRESHYLSRRQLAEAAGVSHSTIVRMEEGGLRTTRDAAEKVVKALSKLIEKPLTIEDISGLKLYNIMRDRKQRTKNKGQTLDPAHSPGWS
jgi:predicted transcriptional regulator